MTGPYLTVDSYTPTNVPCAEAQLMTVVFKNVGADPTTSNTTVTLSSEDPNITITEGTGTFGPLAADATASLTDAFSFIVAAGVPDNTKIQINYTATCGSESWEGMMRITVGAPIITYAGMEWSNGFDPGETKTVTAVFHNAGHYQATNAVVTATTTSEYATITNPSFTGGTIGVGEDGSATFDVTISEECQQSTVIPLTFVLTADNEVTATGEAVMSNKCLVLFMLHDSYGDGWNGCALNVEFSDGTPAENLTIQTGHEAEFDLDISIGTTVTVSFINGSYASETSFEIAYEGGDVIYASSGTPTAGQVCQFIVNCSSVRYDITAVASPEEAGTVTGGGSYMEGSTCTLSAKANSAYSFLNWTKDGEVVSTEANYSFMVTEDADYVANFGPFEGIVIGDGTSTNDYLPSYSWYKYGLSEQIYTADEIGMPCMITSIGLYNGGAEKTRSYNIYMVNTDKSTFSGTSDWLNVTADDMVFSGSVTMTAGEWTTLYLSTPFLYDGSSNLGLVMDDNSGSYTSSPHMSCRVFNATGSQAIYVYSDNSDYNPASPGTAGNLLTVKNQLRLEMQPVGDMRHVTVSANPTSGGMVTGGGYYQPDTEVTITATANTGYTFLNWTSGTTVVTADASYTFTVTEDVDFVANFELNSYTITVSANPEEGGTVTGGNTYNHGATATLTATAHDGYRFVNWTKDNNVVSSNATYTFAVTADGDYVANFAEIVYYEVRVSAEPEGLGTVTGGNTYEDGQQCVITATPADGAYFINWTENGTQVSTAATYTFTVHGNREFVAHFGADNVGEISDKNVVLYPNPTSDKVMIESSEYVRRCEVYSINGALVFTKNECSESFEINVSDYEAGSYIVRLITDNSVQTLRFTKE